MVMAMPGTTLMKNSQRQEARSVIQPPSEGPMTGASVEVMPRMAGMSACLGPLKRA